MPLVNVLLRDVVLSTSFTTVLGAFASSPEVDCSRRLSSKLGVRVLGEILEIASFIATPLGAFWQGRRRL